MDPIILFVLKSTSSSQKKFDKMLDYFAIQDKAIKFTLQVNQC